jgi:hypothetical protein
MRVARLFLLVFALTLTVASLGNAYVGPLLPVKSLKDVEKTVVEVTPLGKCDFSTNIIVRVRFVANAKEYAMLTDARGFILFDLADGDITDSWLGIVRPDNTLVATEYLPYNELVLRYPNACQFFDGIRDATI